MASDGVPHSRRAPTMHRPPMIDMPRAAPAASGIGPMRLEGGVARSGRTLLRALAGDNEESLPNKPILVADGRSTDIDFECWTAPADREVRRDLRERQTGTRYLGTASLRQAERRFE